MPEFSLNNDSRFSSLDSFVQGYIEAMFFTNGDSGDDDEWSFNNLGTRRLTKASIEAIKRDCTQFQNEARALLESAYERDYSEEQAGRDFWFTRQGHGAGYWAREELEVESLGNDLTEICRGYREVNCCIHRGWIHC